MDPVVVYLPYDGMHVAYGQVGRIDGRSRTCLCGQVGRIEGSTSCHKNATMHIMPQELGLVNGSPGHR